MAFYRSHSRGDTCKKVLLKKYTDFLQDTRRSFLAATCSRGLVREQTKVFDVIEIENRFMTINLFATLFSTILQSAKSDSLCQLSLISSFYVRISNLCKKSLFQHEHRNLFINLTSRYR